MEIKSRMQGSNKGQVGMGVSGVSLFFLFFFDAADLKLNSGLIGCPFSFSEQNASAVV